MAAPMPIPGLESLCMQDAPTDAHLSVCVVTSEFLGAVKNGGIATATSALVDSLVRDGHRVTILYTQVAWDKPAIADTAWADLVEAMARRGIWLQHIPHAGDYDDWRTKAWLVKEFVGSGRFDLIYYNEHHGSGYYALAARRAGFGQFARQIHCVITHGATEWVYRTNDEYMGGPSALEVMAFERRSVEWADVVIGPSRYLLNEYRAFGWTLPERTVSQPYALLPAPIEENPVPLPVEELVFFGRLETRKGLWLFCDALDVEPQQVVPGECESADRRF